MSRLLPHRVLCPACGHSQRAVLYESLQAALLPHERDAICAQTFERQGCQACRATFQPEHRLLYVDLPARAWIVMAPPSDLDQHERWERDLEQSLRREFLAAPPALQPSLLGLRPRLVFGQHALAEAVRALRDGLDPVHLECAKLLYYKDNLPQQLSLGPCALRYQGRAPDGALRCLPQPFGQAPPGPEQRLSPRLLQEAAALEESFARSHAALFARPWIDAERYLKLRHQEARP